MIEYALAYARRRKQFGRLLDGFQLVQDQLVRMLSGVTSSMTLCHRLSQLEDEGKGSEEAASLAKACCAVSARQTVGLARELLGGNGILLEEQSGAFSPTPGRDRRVRLTAKGSQHIVRRRCGGSRRILLTPDLVEISKLVDLTDFPVVARPLLRLFELVMPPFGQAWFRRTFTLENSLRLAQIGVAETLREPLVDRLEAGDSVGRPASTMQQPSEARRRAQLPRQRSLRARCVERLPEETLRRRHGRGSAFCKKSSPWRRSNSGVIQPPSDCSIPTSTIANASAIRPASIRASASSVRPVKDRKLKLTSGSLSGSSRLMTTTL